MHSKLPSLRTRPRDTTRTILVAIALVAVAALLWLVREAVIVAFGGIVFATLLLALAGPLSRKTGLSRRVSVVLTVLGLVVVGGLLCWLFGAQVSHEFAELREQLPGAVKKAQDWLGQSPFGQTAIDAVKEATGKSGAAKFGLAAGALLLGLGNIFLIGFVGIYFALTPELYLNGGLRLLPPARRPQVKRALVDAGTSLGKWLVAQALVMASVGVLIGIGLVLLRLPLALALVMALFEFVPVIGPIVAAIPAVLLAFAKGPDIALYTTLVYIVVQQVESNVLTPLIQRWAVELPPVVALLSILAAGLIFGVLGILFATPLAVVTLTLVRDLYVKDTLEKERPGKQEIEVAETSP